MLDKIGKFIGRMLIVLFLLCIAIYLGVAYFYREVFMVNTWINGIYCTGKTVKEVNAELLCETKAPFLTITNGEGETAQINMEHASYKEDYTQSLKSYIHKKQSLFWFKYLTEEKHIDLLPQQTFDEEQLKRLVLSLPIVQKENTSELFVEINLTENGYELQDNLSHVFQPEKFAEYVSNGFHNGELCFNIDDSGAYVDMEPNREQQETIALWERLEKFLHCNIVYDMGAEKIRLDKVVTSQFVKIHESGEFDLGASGNFQVDEAAVIAFVENIVTEYNTCDTELKFEATRGEVINVPYVTYGTELDLEAEIEYLLEAFPEKVAEVHIPKYLQEGYVRGKNDIGDTYIEVDMSEQKLYCYKEGELLLETDIVTGNMRRNWDTPVGVNFVYAKQKNRILRGQGYATPVDFWMPVKGAIGIHDADWRKEFGGEIYLKNGSHGCINIPPENMPIIYENYEIGTPVIMFY
ncbi:MAG: L,D-transpeptidase [Lachnospiraceae bacterium]|nr:L,D-transpeptidase [Lachnospiraceae bacterium]